jgi:dTDP-glucose 4,6-dehydratase
VSDHCAAVAQVLAHGEPGETYNVGGNHERTNLEIVDTVCQTLDQISPRADGRSYGEQKTFVADRPGHDRRYAIDSRKLKSALGWTPKETFESGLEKTIRWYLGHRAWCETVSQHKYARERLGQV